MVFHTEKYEMSATYDEVSSPLSSNDIPKSHSDEERKASSSASGVQRYRVGAITLGLLALVQLGLIIYLALHKSTIVGFQASLKNLTEEREQLIRTINNIETNTKNASGERDDLKRALNDCNLQLNSLTEERDKLKIINFDMEARSKNLTEERDELKRKLDDLVLKQDSWRTERNNLTSMNSDTEARSRIISLERDELKKKLNTLESQHRLVTEERDRMKSKLNIIARPGWTLFRRSAYYISSTKKTWQESRAYCHSVGADLMIINSKEEKVFANSFKLHMWIGLTDSETEGTWKWVDGSPLTTSYWGNQEPNGKTEENCGEIKSFATERSWNDGTCSLQLNWICEMKFTQ